MKCFKSIKKECLSVLLFSILFFGFLGVGRVLSEDEHLICTDAPAYCDGGPGGEIYCSGIIQVQQVDCTAKCESDPGCVKGSEFCVGSAPGTIYGTCYERPSPGNFNMTPQYCYTTPEMNGLCSYSIDFPIKSYCNNSNYTCEANAYPPDGAVECGNNQDCFPEGEIPPPPPPPPPPPDCGNNKIDIDKGETCDDGNTNDGDGCSRYCLEEVCGDSILNPGEQCDDGNTDDGDGCSRVCVYEPDLCGNWTTDSVVGETCDDGNATSGDGCDALCHVEIPGATAVCDNTWRKVPGSQQTIGGPAGAYIGFPKNTQFVDSIALVMRGSDNRVYEQSCKFNLTNVCRWANNWLPDMDFPNSISSFQSSVPPYSSVGDGWDVYAKNAFNHTYHNINFLDGWHNWQDEGVNDSVPWGTPFRFTDKLSRIWQVRRNTDNSVSYKCGATAACTDMVFNTATSKVTPTTVNKGDTVTISCDFGARIQDIAASFDGVNCAWAGWTGTVANYTCTAGNVGTNIPAYCGTWNNPSGDNVCAQTNRQAGLVTVNSNTATINISANPATINSGTASTLTWSYSNANSCTITSPGTISGYPSGSGTASTGNLYNTRTYTLTCDPGAVSKSATVTVLATPNDVTLTVIKAGQGTVTSAPAGINCGGDCTEVYTSTNATNVTLTASPASNRIFTGWSISPATAGTCSGRGPCSLVMDESMQVTASFAIDPNYKEF